MKTYWGVEVQDHTFLTCIWMWSTSHPGHFTPQEQSPSYPLDMMGGGQGRYERGGEKFPIPTGSRTPLSLSPILMSYFGSTSLQY